MFTGIIEALGIIKEVSTDGMNRVFRMESEISSQLKTDESVSHNGICLTVEEVRGSMYRVTAIAETLAKTNAGFWKEGDVINLERSLKINDRLDGHIVQGHVDGTATCIEKKDVEGSVEFTFSFDKKNAALIIEKGSICINGVSLTAFNVTQNTFTVAIIPYTITHTNFSTLNKNDVVNIEFDILGKYVTRIITINGMK
jgi:riboflavin synthase